MACRRPHRSLLQTALQVNNSEQLLHLSKKVIGETATHAIVNQSLFAHFCAGENEQDIQPVLRKLEAAGVGTILDYAAEKDIIEDSWPGLRYVSPSIKCANVRFCERHGMQQFFVVSLPSFLPPCSASSSQCASALRGAPPPCVQGRCSRSRICGRTTVRLQCKFGAGLHRYRLQVFPT